MNIALYCRTNSYDVIHFITGIIHLLKKRCIPVSANRQLAAMLPPEMQQKLDGTFENKQELIELQTNYLFSIGGDGTFIDAANIVEDSGIPIWGINTGRIGFLTNTNRGDFETALDDFENGKFSIEHRSLLHLEAMPSLQLPSTSALNDISIHPSGESLNEIHVFANGVEVNTYWGDGLIVSTPTGSTAYSLSCGGPIIVPSADVTVLTPIASHSLTVRPVVLPASDELKIKVESRTHQFVLSLDSHRIIVDDTVTLFITKEKFTIQTIHFPHADFYSVIREKLMWGLDKRNLTKNEQ